MDVWTLLQATGSILFLICLVPQFVRTLQRRRADDVSLLFLVLVLLGSAVLVPYSAHTLQWYFVASFLGNIVVWGTVLYFRVRPRAEPTSRT